MSEVRNLWLRCLADPSFRQPVPRQARTKGNAGRHLLPGRFRRRHRMSDLHVKLRSDAHWLGRADGPCRALIRDGPWKVVDERRVARILSAAPSRMYRWLA